MDTSRLLKTFQSLDARAPRLFFAPGRVNLIGEHTDYNEGFVLPLALTRGTIAAGLPRTDRTFRVVSCNLDGAMETFSLDAPRPTARKGWIDYVEGVARALESRGVRLTGADLALDSDVPTGAGLSSSAALELAVALALSSLSGSPDIDRKTLALAGQQAEHESVGMQCGIMDQYIAALGQVDHALLIDCRTLEARAIPARLAGAVILVTDSGVKHELAGSAYNDRRRDCEDSVKLLAPHIPGIRALRDVSVKRFAELEPLLPEQLRRRARHVVGENARTLAAAEALAAANLPELGRLMNASHASLRDDYEVSCEEVDVLVHAAQACPGVYGSRMTGGGFGGCTVSVVEQSALAAAQERIAAEYQRGTGLTPTFLVTTAGQGVHEQRQAG